MTVPAEPIAPVELRNCISPAKLNLFLHVLGQRDDGYHELETVFELIDLHDTLHFGIRSDGAIMRRGGIHGLAHDNDLSVQAARLLAAASETRHGVDIQVVKEIPMGGGLGGGSSNAATTLLALNRLWGVNWPVARLARLALQLGADVPVFVHGTAALAAGVGEKLTPLELPKQHYVVVAPPVTVPTAEIFSDPELTRDSKPLKILPPSQHKGGERKASAADSNVDADGADGAKATDATEATTQTLQEAALKGKASSKAASSTSSRRPGKDGPPSDADPMTGLSVAVMEAIGRNGLEAVAFARCPAVEQALIGLNKAAAEVKPEPPAKAVKGKKGSKGKKPAAAPGQSTGTDEAGEQALADAEQDNPDAVIEPRGADWIHARMSGSGGCVFLPVSTRTRAEAIAEKVRQMDIGTVFVATSLKTHPMRSWAFGRGLPRRSS